MRGLNAQRFAAAVSAIDAANAADPNSVYVRGASSPLALVHGRLAAEWVVELAPNAPDEWLLAARAHHLRRWELPRSEFEAGKVGYLRWKREQRQRHATDVAVLLAECGYDEAFITRVQALVRRDDLRTDEGAQAVEDAACLVFVETQLLSVAQALDLDHVLDILRKTAKKMSPAARALAVELAESLTPPPPASVLHALSGAM